MKSKVTASTRTSASKAQADVLRLGILNYEASQYVGYVLGSVGGLLHLGVDVAPLDYVDHVLRMGKKLAQAVAKQIVSAVLEAVYLDYRSLYHLQFAPLAKMRHRFHHLFGAAYNTISQLLSGWCNRFDLINIHHIGGGLNKLGDV